MKRGVALLNVLLVAFVLGGLGLALLVQLSHHYAQQRQRQLAVQALWNARAGVENYLARGQVPPVDPTSGLATIYLETPGDRNRSCDVRRRGVDLVFRGYAGGVVRTIVLGGGDPNQRWEEP